MLTGGAKWTSVIFLDCNHDCSVFSSAKTLLWICRRLIGRSYIALALIHSEDSDLDYFGICCSVAFVFVTHP